MLQIREVSKIYKTGELVQRALNRVSLNFRDNEFVAVLGPSGSGKTTLLNIVGGLDHYDVGDLIINGISTQRYSNRDWDSYRNHSVGFVFQSYNLIPHQTILANVELALTISGVSRKERKRRAKEALEKVGLIDHIHKKPNQLSGGQMQRVAIARALVNDPDILLADEPTGALDSETSIQVMELLKEVAKEKLVIMVTHNPELAETYSNRIVRLKDGQVVGDTNPFEPEGQTAPVVQSKNMGKASMSFGTALSLSFQNLRTKKGRTILTSFAGSIGIIGIALILSLSAGVNRYIETMQKETMASYPITIEAETLDLGYMMTSTLDDTEEEAHDLDQIYSDGSDFELSNEMSASLAQNNLTKFREYLMDKDSPIQEYIGENGVVYSYNTPFTVYTYDPEGKLVNTDGSGLTTSSQDVYAMGSEDSVMVQMDTNVYTESCFEEITPGTQENSVSTLITDNYELAYGEWPKAYNEVVLILDGNNEIPLQTLYALGMLPSSEYQALIDDVNKQKNFKAKEYNWSYENFCNQSFYLVPECDFYQKNEQGLFQKINANSKDAEGLAQAGVKLNVTGIIRPKEDAETLMLSKTVGYTKALTDYLVDYANKSEVVTAQLNSKDKNVLTGTAIDEESYQAMLELFGYVDVTKPLSISIYTDSFEGKEAITKCIEDYNASAGEGNQIVYSDFVELMISSVTSIVDVISYILIAFVAVSLVVSSLMIGIITYISVLERTKEIGILRAMGASKGNISQVFNAETIIIGMCAGIMGILIAVLLQFPINGIIHMAMGNSSVSAALPIDSAIFLILLSMGLTLIGGLIPARKAAKKDPVAALRSE
ncbi:MAG: ABC transporter ATP-binding protein/permease [Agathobacter sp.]|nr:ABC transporter ATP-binding protein/permease [Agathobacter sp.]